MQEAIERGVATPVINAALFARFESQHDDSVAEAVAALRSQFGSRAIVSEPGGPRPPTDPATQEASA